MFISGLEAISQKVQRCIKVSFGGNHFTAKV